MTNKFISILLISVILLFPLASDSNSALSHGQKNSCNFEDIYPAPFYKTKPFVISSIIITAALAAAITYFTAGTGTIAAAGPLVSYIGSSLGSLSGLSGAAATNAGLALLGGGSVASGGFGVLGGISLLSGIGDLALTIALTECEKIFPSNKTERALALSLQIPDRIGGSRVQEYSTKINDIKESQDLTDKVILYTMLDELAHNKNKIIDAENEADFYYNKIVSAICNYNLFNYGAAENILKSIGIYTEQDNRSFFLYFSGMLAVTRGNYDKALAYFDQSAKQEDDVKPYLASSQLHMKLNHPVAAITHLENARKKVDDDNFVVNYQLASLYFKQKDYNKAISMYKDALSDVTINKLEAECKIFIAICYYKLSLYSDAQEWSKEAMAEIDDDKKLQEYYQSVFINSTK